RRARSRGLPAHGGRPGDRPHAVSPFARLPAHLEQRPLPRGGEEKAAHVAAGDAQFAPPASHPARAFPPKRTRAAALCTQIVRPRTAARAVRHLHGTSVSLPRLRTGGPVLRVASVIALLGLLTD